MSDEPSQVVGTSSAAAVSAPPTDAERAGALLGQRGAGAQVREQAARLLMSYQPAHERRLRRLGLRAEDAEEVFMDAVMSFLRYPPRGTNCDAYLSRLLKSRLIDHVRRKRAQLPEPDIRTDEDGRERIKDAVDVQEPTQSDPARRKQLRDCIEGGYERMQAQQSPYAQVLALVAEQWSIEEISDYLGVSYTAGKDRVHRARRAAAPFFEECKE